MNIPDKCKNQTKAKRIPLKEKGICLHFINDSCRDVIKIRVDGCAITEGMRCDYLVLCNKHEYFVELKGSDIGHAVDQIT